MVAERSLHREEADKLMQLKIYKIRGSTSALVSKNSRKLIMENLSEVRNGNKLLAHYYMSPRKTGIFWDHIN